MDVGSMTARPLLFSWRRQSAVFWGVRTVEKWMM
jgi:hypothetical protein